MQVDGLLEAIVMTIIGTIHGWLIVANYKLAVDIVYRRWDTFC